MPELPSAALCALMEGGIDYAGLFPPAGLPMVEAVENYARYRRSPERWMLARFIVPAARLDEFHAAHRAQLPAPGADGPWPLSVLITDPDTLAAARHYGFEHPDRVLVEAFEARPESISALRELAGAVAEGEEIFFELPWQQDPQPWLDAVAASGGLAKLRTGGVEEEDFPDVHELARFLLRCGESGVPLKFTAGLHHPLRGCYALTYEPDSPQGPMHGFLNTFVAAALISRHRLRSGELHELLGEEDPAAFALDESGVRWRDHHLSAARLQEARVFARSFGSCSFTEPIADLKTLELL